MQQKEDGEKYVLQQRKLKQRKRISYEACLFYTWWNNIQDLCNEAGIEILKPHYSAIRDGNHSTIPTAHLPANYKAPGFQLNPLGNLFQIDLNWGSKQHNGKHKTNPNQRVQPRGNGAKFKVQVSIELEILVKYFAFLKKDDLSGSRLIK